MINLELIVNNSKVLKVLTVKLVVLSQLAPLQYNPHQLINNVWTDNVSAENESPRSILMFTSRNTKKDQPAPPKP